MPELRKDPIVGRWVIIATERARRPVDFQVAHDVPRHGLCPFCPGQEAKTPPEILAYRPADGPAARRDAPGWSLRVFPNKFPALMIEGDLDRAGEGVYDRMNGVGAHEVIVETPDHTRTFSQLTEPEIGQVLTAFRDRLLDLRRDQRFKYVMVFKNQGSMAGATLEHTHSQLIALPVVPKTVAEEMDGAREYHRFKDCCVFCDIVRQELRERARLVYENDGFVVIEPYAPKFPFETWVMPKRHRSAYEDAPVEEYALLANAMKVALRKLHLALDNPPYNFILHTSPFDSKENPYYHWHVEIMPTLGKVAGFEWGSGFYINPTPPEEAARFLRELPNDWLPVMRRAQRVASSEAVPRRLPVMRILHVASEVAPYSKTGGLADVLGALPRAQARLGADVAVVSPKYRMIDPAKYNLARWLRTVPVYLGGEKIDVGVYEGTPPGGKVRLYLVDHPPSFDRDGLYAMPGGGDFADNARRFALLSRAALEIAAHMNVWPDVVHAHDWQAGPALLHARYDSGARRIPKTVFTIHNLAYQGLFPEHTIEQQGFPRALWNPDGFEFYGQLSYLKAGIVLADAITTVSPRYAAEIQTPEQGMGMDGLLRTRADRLVGILNGVDYDVWSPDRDPHLPRPFSKDDSSGKRVCKAALQREVGLPQKPDTPLAGTISRFAHQKGFDLIVDALAELLPVEDMQYLVLGSGDAVIEKALGDLQKKFPQKLALRVAYDDPLAHRIEAGADLYVMPSRYEPCGLNQLYSLRYGTVPIVRATGGLDDTIVDFEPRSRSGTGFKFEPYTKEALVATWQRALHTYRHAPGELQALARRGMAQDFSWTSAAQRTLDVYQRVSRASG